MTADSLLGALSLLLVAAAPDLPVFTAGWLLAGAAMVATFHPPAFAALTRWYAPDHVRALTVVTLAGGLASTASPPPPQPSPTTGLRPGPLRIHRVRGRRRPGSPPARTRLHQFPSRLGPRLRRRREDPRTRLVRHPRPPQRSHPLHAVQRDRRQQEVTVRPGPGTAAGCRTSATAHAATYRSSRSRNSPTVPAWTSPAPTVIPSPPGVCAGPTPGPRNRLHQVVQAGVGLTGAALSMTSHCSEDSYVVRGFIGFDKRDSRFRVITHVLHDPASFLTW